MIAYFDTSAIVPLIVAEPSSAHAARLWQAADRVVSARLVYPEARAALAQARRLERLTARELMAAVRQLDGRMEELDIVEIDAVVARRAGELAQQRALQGYDAVHLAAADRVRDDEFVVVAGDAPFLAAARAERLATAAL